MYVFIWIFEKNNVTLQNNSENRLSKYPKKDY